MSIPPSMVDPARFPLSGVPVVSQTKVEPEPEVAEPEVEQAQTEPKGKVTKGK